MPQKNWFAAEGGHPYPHCERGHFMFLLCTDVFGAIENYLFTFSTKKKHECNFTSDRVQFSHTAVQKKIPKTDRSRLWQTSVYQFTATYSFNDNFSEKRTPSIFLYNTKSRKQSQKSSRLQCVKGNCHYAPKVYRNNNLQHQIWKSFKNNLRKRVDRVGKFTVKSTRNPSKRFRSKKNEVHCTRCFRKAV